MQTTPPGVELKSYAESLPGNNAKLIPDSRGEYIFHKSHTENNFLASRNPMKFVALYSSGEKFH
jgi:hypothetical protein